MAHAKSSRRPQTCPPIQGPSTDQAPVADDAQEESPSAYLNLNQPDDDAPEVRIIDAAEDGPTTDAPEGPTTESAPDGQSSKGLRHGQGPSKASLSSQRSIQLGSS